MSETFGLEIYASNKLAYAGRAQKLIIPAVDGEQGFLAHHANVVATIIPGEMRFEDADGNTHVSDEAAPLHDPSLPAHDGYRFPRGFLH